MARAREIVLVMGRETIFRARTVWRTPGRAPGTTAGRWFVTRAQISERRGWSGVTSPGQDDADGAFGHGRADVPLAVGQFPVLAVLRPGKPQPSAGPGVALGMACDGRCPSVRMRTNPDSARALNMCRMVPGFSPWSRARSGTEGSWWGGWGSNPRPADYESAQGRALPYPLVPSDPFLPGQAGCIGTRRDGRYTQEQRTDVLEAFYSGRWPR